MAGMEEVERRRAAALEKLDGSGRLATLCALADIVGALHRHQQERGSGVQALFRVAPDMPAVHAEDFDRAALGHLHAMAGLLRDDASDSELAFALALVVALTDAHGLGLAELMRYSGR